MKNPLSLDSIELLLSPLTTHRHTMCRILIFGLAMGFGLGVRGQQLTVDIPVYTSGVVISAFDVDVSLGSSAALPGTGIWKFSGTDEIALSNLAGEGAQFPNVQMLNANGIRLANGSMYVRGQLRFGQGIIRTSAYEVVMDQASSASNARNSSHVEGFVSKIGNTDFVFPLGANGVYHPVEVFGISGGISSFRAAYFPEGHPDPLGPWYDGNNWPISTCDYWQVERSTGTAEASIRLDWSSSDCNEVTDNQYMRVARYNAGAWQLLPSEVEDSDAESVLTSSNQGLFGDFALASIGGGINQLPIDLLHFDARVEGSGAVQCVWVTASEVNNDYFRIERSQNGIAWVSAGQVEGAGFSSTALQYQYTDKAPHEGQSYYRLRQVDFDGSETIYEPVAVYIANDGQRLAIDQVYRSEQGLRLHYRAAEAPVLVEIFDLYGKKVFSKTLQGQPGATTMAPWISDGFYIVRLTQFGISQSAKFKW